LADVNIAKANLRCPLNVLVTLVSSERVESALDMLWELKKIVLCFLHSGFEKFLSEGRSTMWNSSAIT